MMGFRDLLDSIRLNWGVHPEGHKTLSNACAIEVMPLPDRLVLPLAQHIGAVACSSLDALSDLPDAAIIAAPSHLHRDVAEKLAGQGGG